MTAAVGAQNPGLAGTVTTAKERAVLQDLQPILFEECYVKNVEKTKSL